MLGAAAASEKKGAAGGATSGDDEEGEVWDPYNDDTESNVGGSSMNLGDAGMQKREQHELSELGGTDK